METINIASTEDTPEIILDADNKKYAISGRSLPEDVSTFYAPVMRWLDDLEIKPIKDLELEIKLEYFNTASSKIILDILMKIEDINNKSEGNMKIKWFYDSSDEDMLEAGEEYKELVDLPFEMVAF
jgi:hypothetical protein